MPFYKWHTTPFDISATLFLALLTLFVLLQTSEGFNLPPKKYQVVFLLYIAGIFLQTCNSRDGASFNASVTA
jgi:hypothetical protein